MSRHYWERHGVVRKQRIVSKKGAEQLSFEICAGKLPWRTVRDTLSDLPDPQFSPLKGSRIANHKFQPGARAYPGHTGSPLDEPAKTLKAGVHGVPGGENMLARENGEIRYFTVREAARLQTFPDEFVFHGSWTECMRQIGNAVPVALATILAEAVAARLQRAEQVPGFDDRRALQPA